jgi:hypothetical protein
MYKSLLLKTVFLLALVAGIMTVMSRMTATPPAQQSVLAGR